MGSRLSFCPYCGAQADADDCAPHLRCRSCGEVTYRNPAVGVAVIVIQEGKILLGRRGRGPKAGLWCIPCGYVECAQSARYSMGRM